MNYYLLRLTFISLIAGITANAQPGLLTPVAGNGSSIYSGDNVPATSASIGSPRAISLDRAGNIYIADSTNSRILKVNILTGILTSIAGGGTGGDGGLAVNAALNSPCGVTLDSADNVFISESCITASSGAGPGGGAVSFSRLRRIDAQTGVIVTFAGNGTNGFSGDNGPSPSASLNVPAGLAFDGAGRLFFADSGNNRVRRIDFTNAIINTVAGDGNAQFFGDGFPAQFASLNSPVAVAFDSNGNLYIADLANSRIRKVDAMTGIMSTIAGTDVRGFNGDSIPATSAQISFPFDVKLDSVGNIYFVDGGNSRIRRIDALTGLISTIAGGGFQPAANGMRATDAILNQPFGLAISPTNRLYFSESGGARIWSFDLPSNLAPSTTILAATPTTVAPFQPITLTATVSPAPASGTVTFSTGVNNLGTATLVSGVASIVTTIPLAGNFPIEAKFSGNSTLAASTSNSINISVKSPTETFLYASASNATAGQPVTFNASVTPSQATGTVQFFNGPTVIGTVTLVNGAASISTSQLPAGSNSITARYLGDSSYNPSTSSPAAILVKSPSTTVVTFSANPAQEAQPVTITATVAPANATGAIQFLNGSTLLASTTIANGAASFTTSQLARGTYSITATYSGDNQTSPSTSSPLSLAIKATSRITLSGSPDPAIAGQNVNFVARLTPNTATGTVQFLNGNTTIGTANIANGVATLATRDLTPGTYSIVASYSGDTNFLPSTSAPQSQTIKVRSVLTLASSANPATLGQPITFTATVNPPSAVGVITFRQGNVVIATAPLSNGAAAFTTSQLPLGPSSISASFPGDAQNSADTSNTIRQVVKTVATVTLSTSVNPSVAGEPVTFTATVSPATATGSVQFLNGTTALGSAQVMNGVARFTTTRLTVGTFTINANYNGDSLNTPASASISQMAIAAITACSVTYTATPQSASTFTAAFSIRNTGNTTLDPWALTFTWPGTQQVTQASGATFTQTGRTVRLVALPSNRTIAPGATLDGIGITANFTGSNTPPPAFSVNGVRCQ